MIDEDEEEEMTGVQSGCGEGELPSPSTRVASTLPVLLDAEAAQRDFSVKLH